MKNPEQRTTVHELKTWPYYFEEVWNGTKTFEVRKNDRDFRVGDTLILQEYDHEFEREIADARALGCSFLDSMLMHCSPYSGRVVTAKVTYIMPGGRNGLNHDHCIMAISVECRTTKSLHMPVMKDPPLGYHMKKIERGTYGEADKIREEFEEWNDAREQENPIMELCELSDLIGAIEGYALNKHGISLENLLAMKNATQRAFQNGHRK